MPAANPRLYFQTLFQHKVLRIYQPLSSTNISGDRAVASRQSKKCPQKHGGFWPNLRHFDVTIDLFLVNTTDQKY